MDLVKLGVTPNKSKVLTFPNFIEKRLICHFIRGLFDGDGTVNVKKSTGHLIFNIVGTLDIVVNVQKILINECAVSSTKILTKGSISCVEYGSNDYVKKIGIYLYHNATIFLERKKEKFSHERNNLCKKPIKCIKCETGEEFFFESAKEASRTFNIPLSNISNCALGKKNKTAGGYKWFYLN
jgi:hypothetical protein